MDAEMTEPMEKGKIMLDPGELGGGEFKGGDKIILTVIGHTSEGMLECEHEAPKQEMSWDEDFDKTMSPSTEEEPAHEATDGGGAEEVS